MAFEKTSVNYATEYSGELRNVYPYVSYFSDIFNSAESQRFKPVNGNTVMIPSLTAKGARDRKRGEFGGDKKVRNVNNEWFPFTLDMEREWDTTLDPADIKQSNATLAVANATKTFVEQQKIPEMDAYVAYKINKLANDYSANGATVDTTAVNKENVLEVWDGYMRKLANGRVRKENVRAYATPTFMKTLKNAGGIMRFIENGESGGTMLNRNIKGLDEITIKEVPEDIMQTAFNFTEGWKKGAGAKQINLIIIDLTAAFCPILYDVSQTQAPCALTANNWYYYEAYSYGLGVHKTRATGIIVNVAGGESQINTLSLDEDAVDLQSLTNDELKAMLDIRGIEYNSKATKSELIALLEV
ncbi:hypothetical protein [Thomasclavelia cocleata]|uniref:hypothetical protein n=1 Tax=Thomasclavelia cocleata TaxID=69824 RepID=UPI00242EA1ED|nr:hypothetical protein [Thomasclavelia cocleata]